MNEENLNRPIVSIGDQIKKMKDRKGPNSQRAYAIECLMIFMGEKPENNTKRFKYWLGRTRKLEPEMIFTLMSLSKGGNPRVRLFNYLLKRENEKI